MGTASLARRRDDVADATLPAVDQNMGTHMKTTIELSEAVLAEARELAASEGTTLRALVEAGLRKVLAERRHGRSRFVLRNASVKGRGLQPALQGASWDELRELAYEGHGSARKAGRA
jgi:hypothetical protein